MNINQIMKGKESFEDREQDKYNINKNIKKQNRQFL
jgi:hypothetical protein